MIIAGIIDTILVNLISNYIVDKGQDIKNSKNIEKKINEWTTSFFSNHVERVFETSRFNEYIELDKPIDKIYRFVMESIMEPAISEQEFIANLASACKNYIVENGDICSNPEESVIKELFNGILNLLKTILNDNASDGEKLAFYQIQQTATETKLAVEANGKQLSEIANQLARCDKITDQATTRFVYNLLSNLMWNGDFETVYSFLNVLCDKNDDLENAIKIRLKVLSDYDIAINNPLELCKNISDPVIKDDLFRLIALDNFSDLSKLAPYTDQISDSTLKKIIESMVSNLSPLSRHKKKKIS